MNLIIDFGNTYGKAAIFEDSEIKDIFRPIKPDDVAALYAKHQPQNVIISSTSIDPTLLKSKTGNQGLILSYKTPLPFQIAYKTPETLGLDRIAGVAGAHFIFPNDNCLVIDLGTCITYDILIDKQYLGGGISPGLQMRFKALNTFTAKLPLVQLEQQVELVGDSTKNAILSGVVNGMKAEIEEIIRMYCDKYGSLQIIICGGDSIFFENKLKASIFAAPELVLRGLNGILRYNES